MINAVNNYIDAEKAKEYFLLHKNKDNRLLEKDINCWLDAQISNSLKPNSLVCDLGCGTGRFFDNLKKWSDYVIGIEESQEMIERCCASNKNCVICHPSKELIIRKLLGSNLPIIKGNIFEIMPKLERETLYFDFILASFLLPGIKGFKELFSQTSRILKKKGKLLLTDNIFVNNRFSAPKHIDLNEINERFGLPCHGSCFRQVLHLSENNIGLQNYVHTLEQYKVALDSIDELKIKECIIFPAEGCSHVSSDYNYQGVSFPNLPDGETLLEPSDDFKYVKLGMLLEKQ